MALLTLAVLLMLPAADGETTPRRSVTEEVPFDIAPNARLPLQGCHDAPLSVEYSVLVSAGATLSVKTTESAISGPLFLTVERVSELISLAHRALGCLLGN